MTREHLIRRLAFIRHLHRLASDQATQARPFRDVALLTLQDSVELFLVLASEYLGRPVTPKASFDECLRAITAPESPHFASAATLMRMNKARVYLKHHGFVAANDEVSSFVAAATDYLRSVSTDLLQVDFDAASLADLVVDRRVRKALDESAFHVAAGQYGLAIDFAMVAMHRAREAYRPPYEHPDEWIETPNNLLLRWRHPFSSLDGLPRRLEEFANDLVKAVRLLAEQVDTLTLGLSWDSYARFIRYGSVFGSFDGGEWIGHSHLYPDPTVDDARFCLDFAIDAALRLQPSAAAATKENAASDLGTITKSNRLAKASEQVLLELRTIGSDVQVRQFTNARLSRIQRFPTLDAAERELRQAVTDHVAKGWTVLEYPHES